HNLRCVSMLSVEAFSLCEDSGFFCIEFYLLCL
ncbi:hypothetical protein LCGC14_3116100, partial [marine sediment metagenome]